MKKTVCLTAALLIAAALLTACGKDAGEGDAPKEPPKPATTTFTSEDGSVALDAPEGWKLKTGGVLTGAALELAVGEDGEEEALCVVINEEKPTDDTGAATLTLAEYSDKVVGSMVDPKRLTDASTSQPKSVKLPGGADGTGMDAIFTEIDGSIASDAGSPIPFHYWVYCVDNGSHYTQLVAWTSGSRADAYSKTIPALLESFHTGAGSASGTGDPAGDGSSGASGSGNAPADSTGEVSPS